MMMYPKYFCLVVRCFTVCTFTLCHYHIDDFGYDCYDYCYYLIWLIRLVSRLNQDQDFDHQPMQNTDYQWVNWTLHSEYLNSLQLGAKSLTMIFSDRKVSTFIFCINWVNVPIVWYMTRICFSYLFVLQCD